MLIQHEHQHNETMLQTLAARASPACTADPARAARHGRARRRRAGACCVEAGRSRSGDPGVGFAYDNERPRTRSRCGRSRSTALPVTNGAYLEFVDDGGYAGASCGPARAGTGAARGRRAPAVLERRRRASGASTASSRSSRTLPVMHVSWYEADAYRALGGRRLPTEARVGEGGRLGRRQRHARLHPWGDEPPTLEPRTSTSSASAPRRRAPIRRRVRLRRARHARRRLGVDGERLRRLPGLRAPSPTASTRRSFFGGDYKVLRGGSWATRPRVARNTFRNWDLPERRQIFAGFRCAQRRGRALIHDRLPHRPARTGIEAGGRRARRASRARSRSCRRSTSTTARAPTCSTASPTLPEYYPTRCEREILEPRGRRRSSRGAEELVELGSGSATKTRALLTRGRRRDAARYVPVDVDGVGGRALRATSCRELYPGLDVHGLVGDFQRHLERLPDGERRLFAFLGGTIGNFHPDERAEFLARLRELMAAATGCSSAPTSSRTAACSRPLTTTPPA